MIYKSINVYLPMGYLNLPLIIGFPCFRSMILVSFDEIELHDVRGMT